METKEALSGTAKICHRQHSSSTDGSASGSVAGTAKDSGAEIDEEPDEIGADFEWMIQDPRASSARRSTRSSVSNARFSG